MQKKKQNNFLVTIKKSLNLRDLLSSIVRKTAVKKKTLKKVPFDLYNSRLDDTNSWHT